MEEIVKVGWRGGREEEWRYRTGMEGYKQKEVLRHRDEKETEN